MECFLLSLVQESKKKISIIKKERVVMNIKKKEIYLGLLLSMLGIGSAVEAYKVRVRNSTPFTIKFIVEYHAPSLIACRRDVGELAPGHEAEIQSGLCTVKSVGADVFQKKYAGTMLETKGTALGERVIKANRYKAPLGRAGDTVFTISGPFLSSSKRYRKQDGVFYQISRSVN